MTEFFHCSLYEVDLARDVLNSYGPCEIEPKVETVYSRLIEQKARHFIDFLFSTGLLQEFARSCLWLDQIEIRNIILNCLHEHAINEYLIYCNEIEYMALGRPTLIKVLKKMKPRIRRKLAGIDTKLFLKCEEVHERICRHCLNVVNSITSLKSKVARL